MANKPPEPQEASQTDLSKLISDAMDRKNLSIRGLAEKLDLTYEHVRRFVRGDSVPLGLVLKAICQELGIDYKHAQQLSVAAKIQNKYGNIPAEIAGKNPELLPIERVWEDLTVDQKKDAVGMIQGWAKRNRAMRG